MHATVYAERKPFLCTNMLCSSHVSYVGCMHPMLGRACDTRSSIIALLVCAMPKARKNESNKCKNQVRCRDDTMPKIIDTRKHCEIGEQSSATPSLHLVFWGLQKIVACSQPYLAVPSCIYCFWYSVIPTFIFTLVYMGLRACTQPKKTRCRDWVAEGCCMLSTLLAVYSFLCLQFLAWCHPYILYTLLYYYMHA